MSFRITQSRSALTYAHRSRWPTRTGSGSRVRAVAGTRAALDLDPADQSPLDRRLLSVADWTAEERRVARQLEQEAAGDGSDLLRAFDEAYVHEIEERLGALSAADYAATIHPRGRQAPLNGAPLPRAAMLRLKRHALRRAASDSVFARDLQRALTNSSN